MEARLESKLQRAGMVGELRFLLIIKTLTTFRADCRETRSRIETSRCVNEERKMNFARSKRAERSSLFMRLYQCGKLIYARDSSSIEIFNIPLDLLRCMVVRALLEVSRIDS